MKPGSGEWARILVCVIGIGLLIGLPVAAVAKSVTLAWGPNTEQDLAGYKIHIGTSPRTYTQTIAQRAWAAPDRQPNGPGRPPEIVESGESRAGRKERIVESQELSTLNPGHSTLDPYHRPPATNLYSPPTH